MVFPGNFVWGAATSAYQIEGASEEDGKGKTIWDVFCAEPGRVWENGSATVACDHYHHVAEDVALMACIPLQAYRFSVSWTRVLPEGTGRINRKGLDFYDSLVDELLRQGIDPWVTLFHWDYPHELLLRGGWLNADSSKWFAEYVSVIVRRLSDRVSYWTTLNQPQCFIGAGYREGNHAPGLKLDLAQTLLAAHNCLLAHGRGVQSIREHARAKPTIGWSPTTIVYHPATECPEDIEAARTAMLGVYADSVWNNCWWSDPVVFGRYPEEGLRAYGSAVPPITSAEMEIINQPIDFYGCNIFQSMALKAGTDGKPSVAPLEPGHPHSDYLWNLTPEALYWGPRVLSDYYKRPLVITENGVSDINFVGHDRRVHDVNRIEFISQYLLQVRRALQEGIDIRGYFYWSLLDNFEWSEGYKHRFGLIYVNFATGARILKDSAQWYGEVIQTNGKILTKYESKTAAQHYLTKQAVEYIHMHLRSQFNVKVIASHLRCHPDFLSRKFKQDVGEDLGAYIRRTRIERAVELLKEPDANIDEVAEMCGFADRIYFTKSFRKVTGTTPGEFHRRFKA